MYRTVPVTERITTVSVSITPLRNLTPDSSEPVVTPVDQLGHLLLRGVEAVQDAGGVPGQREPRCCALDRAGAALDEGQSHFAFQGGDVLADRRLRQRQHLGGSGEASLSGNLVEHSQAADVQHKRYL